MRVLALVLVACTTNKPVQQPMQREEWIRRCAERISAARIALVNANKAFRDGAANLSVDRTPNRALRFVLAINFGTYRAHVSRKQSCDELPWQTMDALRTLVRAKTHATIAATIDVEEGDDALTPLFAREFEHALDGCILDGQRLAPLRDLNCE